MLENDSVSLVGLGSYLLYILVYKLSMNDQWI